MSHFRQRTLLTALTLALASLGVLTVPALAAQPTFEWLTVGEYALEGDPLYQAIVQALETPWVTASEHNGIAYFVFASPPHIQRYDLTSALWLEDLSLPETPTAFAVDEQGLYVGFGRRTSRFELDGTEEMHLRNTNVDATELFTVGDFLYIYAPPVLHSVHKLTAAFVDSKDYFYTMQGFSVAPSIGKAFSRSRNVSPSDIVQVVLHPDGTLGPQDDSPYHGDYPSATRTFVFPGEARVAEDSGIVYNTGNLTFSNSLAGSFDDLAFFGDLPIVLREGTLISYSNAFLETGRYTPEVPPIKIFIRDETVYSFSSSDGSLAVNLIPIDWLTPDEPGQPVDPTGLSYEPDIIVLGKDEVVYLLSSSLLSVFRWSVAQHRYLETFPLVRAPSFMAYSDVTHRLYLAHPSGEITEIDPDTGQETPFVNSPQTPCGLATAGEYVFVCDPSGAWVSHFTYHPDGTLISQEEWNYFSHEYVWSEANRKMYFFRDNTSPNDLIWEEIDEDGVIGWQMDSPYHSSSGIQHPIRVAPDGSVVLLGSGRLYDAHTLDQINVLSNNIDDAVWDGGRLFTLRLFGESSQLQRWEGGAYALTGSRELAGSPLRLFSLDDRLLVISSYQGAPIFTEWTFDLENHLSIWSDGFESGDVSRWTRAVP